jgi:transcriptional regulator with XRE-family HTH domain
LRNGGAFYSCGAVLGWERREKSRPISDQRAPGHNFNLALPIQWNVFPFRYSGFFDAQGTSQRRLGPEVMHGVLFGHGLSMAWRTMEGKNTGRRKPYALGMADTITDRINATMGERGIKPIDLARQVGVSKQTVSDWMSGRSINIKPENLVSLADVLGVEIRWLVSGVGPKVPLARLPADIQRAAVALADMPEETRHAFVTVVLARAA